MLLDEPVQRGGPLTERSRSGIGLAGSTISSRSRAISECTAAMHVSVRAVFAQAGSHRSIAGEFDRPAGWGRHRDAACRAARDIVHRSLMQVAGKLAGSGFATVASTPGDAAQLSASAATLGGQLAPRTSTAGALSTASDVLSVLKPTMVVGHVLNVAAGVRALDVPGILRNLTVLPKKVAALTTSSSR